MPAERHLETASGTAARGGSIMDMRPTKRRLSTGKLTSSALNGNPTGNFDAGSSRSQNPRTRSPRPPSSMYALLKLIFQSSERAISFPLRSIVEHRSRMRSGAPFMTKMCPVLLSFKWIDTLRRKTIVKSWLTKHCSLVKDKIKIKHDLVLFTNNFRS